MLSIHNEERAHEKYLAPPHKVRIFILKKYDVYTILPTNWNHYNVSTRHAFKCL